MSETLTTLADTVRRTFPTQRAWGRNGRPCFPGEMFYARYSAAAPDATRLGAGLDETIALLCRSNWAFLSYPALILSPVDSGTRHNSRLPPREKRKRILGEYLPGTGRSLVSCAVSHPPSSNSHLSDPSTVHLELPWMLLCS